MSGPSNEADDPGATVEPGGAMDRRAMLKAAAFVGAGGVAWAAPRIETLGFAPAGAAGTPCIILSPASDDKQSQSGQNNCPIPLPQPCCGQSFGDAGKVDTFTFTNPAPNCSEIVVRTITLDCNAANKNPDVGQFAVVIQSTTGAGCGVCTVLDGVLIASSGRAVLQSLNNGPSACLLGGVDASLSCTNPLLVPSSRLAVRISCVTGVPGCVTTP